VASNVYRRRWLGRLVSGGPNLLVHDGKLMKSNLNRELITREELEVAARSKSRSGGSCRGCVFPACPSETMR